MTLRSAVKAIVYVALAVAVCGAAFIGFATSGPCEYRYPDEIARVDEVVHAIHRFKLERSKLPEPGNDEDMTRVGLPGHLAANYELDKRGGFTVKSVGLHGMMSFDGPWVEYSSATGTYVCHAM
ncbi:hypothetical protein ASE35_03950 [Lysobacter sp. Root916]|nr:hypothetical protein ASE35_03950 [Lysobacter sp. Root916]